MNGDELLTSAEAFRTRIEALRSSLAPKDFAWYPYGSLGNMVHLRRIFNEHPLQTLTSSRHIADIGAADGDVAFFMASLGYDVDVIDYGPTNANGLRGYRALAGSLTLPGRLSLLERDIDSQFELPASRYDLVFFLGILYHLKNPYFILERLARHARHLLLSTRVMRFAPDERYLAGLPVAYLLGPTESNNDSTNYWIMTEVALHRLADRAGWEVLSLETVGDTASSNPSDAQRDERAFALLRSRHCA
jgi:tRNA (mo5U34)-methyltransferase